MGRGAGRAESRFAAARPGTAGVYTPRPRYGGQIAFWGLGAERQTGLCVTQRNGGRLDNLALQNCLYNILAPNERDPYFGNMKGSEVSLSGAAPIGHRCPMHKVGYTPAKLNLHK